MHWHPLPTLLQTSSLVSSHPGLSSTICGQHSKLRTREWKWWKTLYAPDWESITHFPLLVSLVPKPATAMVRTPPHHHYRYKQTIPFFTLITLRVMTFFSWSSTDTAASLVSFLSPVSHIPRSYFSWQGSRVSRPSPFMLPSLLPWVSQSNTDSQRLSLCWIIVCP